MGWRLLLTLVFAVGVVPADVGDSDPLEDGDRGLLGTIVTDSDDGRVDLEGAYGSNNGEDSSADGGANREEGFETAPSAQALPDGCLSTNTGFIVCPADNPSAQDEPATTVTLRDIASFRPATPGNGMEPGGWAIEDLPANFVAAASVEVVSGTLLGQPADVRFTPVGYRWTHSDGAVVESGHSGASWATLGLREFSATPTSHSYAESGEYIVELSVVLRAEYRFAGSEWRAIAGTLSIAGEPQRVLVGQFDTVLTQGDYNTHPSGPGC